jgi:hypothetical protein
MQDIWDTMKRPILQIMGVKEGDRNQKHWKPIQ